MLPPPTLSFTIPSIHDELAINCRIYHPACLVPTTISIISEWRKRAAIVAHPYAPLGGSYDDPVVDVLAATILKQGFIVGTFNFRGAGSSKGRTSWQSVAEQHDYMSFIGFMVYYLYHLQPPTPPVYGLRSPKFARSDPGLHELSTIPSQAAAPPQNYNASYLAPTRGNQIPTVLPHNVTRLLLAGYSYGSLITMALPPIISSIIEPFQEPRAGSAHAEIRLRAESLASQQSELMKIRLRLLLSQQPHGRSLHNEDHILHSPKLRGGNVRMGGDEDIRRASHDSHRSRSSFTIETSERVRKSIDRIRSIGKHGRLARRTNSQGSIDSVASYKKDRIESSNSADDIAVLDTTEEREIIKPILGIEVDILVAYLLVSPLKGLISSLATMWSPPFKRYPDLSGHDMKLTIDPTLALFGDDDIFVSIKKLRPWAEKLALTARDDGKKSQFKHREIPGAGHFWHNHEAIQILRDEVREFVSVL